MVLTFLRRSRMLDAPEIGCFQRRIEPPRHSGDKSLQVLNGQSGAHQMVSNPSKVAHFRFAANTSVHSQPL